MILKTIAGDKVRSEYFYRELRVPSLGLQWLSLAGLLAAYAVVLLGGLWMLAGLAGLE